MKKKKTKPHSAIPCACVKDNKVTYDRWMKTNHLLSSSSSRSGLDRERSSWNTRKIWICFKVLPTKHSKPVTITTAAVAAAVPQRLIVRFFFLYLSQNTHTKPITISIMYSFNSHLTMNEKPQPSQLLYLVPYSQFIYAYISHRSINKINQNNSISVITIYMSRKFVYVFVYVHMR